MAFKHDFKKYPELTNRQMEFYYFDSPWKQITEGFTGKVSNIHDGDTITIDTDFRDFGTIIRFTGINAPELKNPGGLESKAWLENQIRIGEEVYIKVNPKQRVGKFGRILGEVFANGVSINDLSLQSYQAVVFGTIPPLPDFNNDLRRASI